MDAQSPGPGDADPADPAVATGPISTNRDFRKAWVGETVNLIGTQVTMFALPLVGVLTLHAGVFQVGLLNALRTVPVIVVSLFAGVWLDRRRRRPIMIGCALANALILGLVPISFAVGLLSMGLLYVICTASGILTVVYDVGVQTYVPSIVEPEHLVASNSRMQTSYSISLIAGPSLAGLLVGIITAPVTMTVDAVSYLCTAIGMISIRRPEPAPSRPAVQPSVLTSIAEGLRAVYRNRLLLTLLNLSGTFNFVQSAFITIFMVYAVRNEHASPVRLGIVLGAIAVGGIAGSMCTVRIGRAIGVGRTMLLTIGGAVFCPMILLVPHDFSAPAVLLMSAGEFCYGFGVLAFNVHAITIRQAVTPSRLLGRTNAAYRLVVTGTAPLGAVLIGVLGEYAGVHAAFEAAVLSFPAAVLWAPFAPVFRLKTIPSQATDDEPAAAIAALVPVQNAE